MCILMGKSLECFRTAVFHSIIFYAKNAKIDCIGEKKILCSFLIDLKCRWLESCLAKLEKHKTLALLLMVDFLRVFKIIHILELVLRVRPLPQFLRWYKTVTILQTDK